MLTAQTYQCRWPLPTFLQREVDNALGCPVYAAGRLQGPTSGTITIRDSSGSLIVDDEAVTVVGNIATYTVAAAVLPSTLGLESKWTVEWSLVMPDRAVAYIFRNSAALVRGQIAYAPISDIDLLSRHRDLERIFSKTQSSLADYIDEAWNEILGSLIANSRKPYLIVEASALRSLAIYKSLELAFRDAETSNGGKYKDMAELYQKKADKAAKMLSFDYDADDDGVIDETVTASIPIVLGEIPRCIW